MDAGSAAAGCAAAAAIVAAPLLLARARARGEAGRAARWGGWSMLPVAVALLAPFTGTEIGLAWVLAALPLPAWAWIGWHRERRAAGRMRVERAEQVEQAGRAEPTPAAAAAAATAAPAGRRVRGGRAVLRIAAALPLAGVAALLVAIQAARPAGSVGVGMLTALTLFVVLWATAALWAFSDPRPGRPAAALLLAGLAAAWPLWLA